ncbi:MAG: hypothetical protein JSS27_04585 [Planctomycetes bacterium]|nr:hypothetical protein [Planctomycetota bacterium]
MKQVDSVVFALGACALLIVVGTIWIRVRTRRTALSRSGENFDTFRAAFAPHEPPQEVLLAVYAELQRWCADAAATFPIRADDDIGRIYGMVDEDLDETIQKVIADCGRQFPPDEQLVQVRPVVTVRDLVGLVANCPSISALLPGRADLGTQKKDARRG